MSESNVKIYVPPEKLWNFYIENNERCQEEMVLIAENTDTKYAIYITDDDGVLMISVCKGDCEPEYNEYAMSKDDCLNTVKRMLFQYLVPLSVVDGIASIYDDLPNTPDDNETVLSRQDIEDNIYEREDALCLALKDFLAVVLQEDDDMVLDTYGQTLIDETLNHFLEYLAEEQGLEIFRPMFIWDEATGNEIYTQFPY